MKKKRLGEVLSERGYISPADLGSAIEDQQGKLVRLGELLLKRGLVSKGDLAPVLSEVLRVPYVQCESLAVEADALQLIPHELAKRWCALPVQIQYTNKLVTVIAEPQNLQIVDELRFSTGMEIIPRLAFRDEIEASIGKWYGGAQSAAPAGPALETEDHGLEFISRSSLQANVEVVHEMQAELLQKSTPAVRLVASTITAAVNKQASDVHIEPQAGDAVVRFRVDGMLRDYLRVPHSLQSSVISRIKILSGMDIAERTAPQTGRFVAKVAGRTLDLRVSTLPTHYGENLVLRLLDTEAPFQDFAALGLPDQLAGNLQRVLSLPQGMVLVTGPTKSGRSTTVYSALNYLRKSPLNIITVEDPVEYVVPGLNQVQVNAAAGLTFASCLRSILRQDPNVVMIGEIRDKETAELALKAAASGPLLISTLHTNDSVSAITRLLDLGVPAGEIASSVGAIVSQRLIRRLCDCHKVAPASTEVVARLRSAGMSPPEMESVPVGCELCDLTGYKGRIGVFELLELNDAVRSAIRSGTRAEEIRALVRRNGMKQMQEYALERVREGLTTLEEVLRVIPFGPMAAASCASCGSEISSGFQFCPFCGAKAGHPGPAAKTSPRSLAGQGAPRE